MAQLSPSLYTVLLKVQPADAALVSVNEKVELDAQKAFYEKIEKEMGMKRAKKLNFWQNMKRDPVLPSCTAQGSQQNLP